MIFSILPDIRNASALLDHLSEAEYDDVSVVMKDEKMRDTIASDDGPLRGCEMKTIKACLAKQSVKPGDIEKITWELGKGGILIAVRTERESEKSAIEIIRNQKAQSIIIV